MDLQKGGRIRLLGFTTEVHAKLGVQSSAHTHQRHTMPQVNRSVAQQLLQSEQHAQCTGDSHILHGGGPKSHARYCVNTLTLLVVVGFNVGCKAVV
jgi:hypothetical protein